MTSLIIDTSSDLCLFGLTTKTTPLALTTFTHANQLATLLMPTLLEFLLTHNLKLQEISQIALGLGPGSYTGTRVGVTVAKTLAFGLNIPLKGFCSLMAYLPNIEGKFAAIIPAKSGNFFLLKGERKNTSLIQTHCGLIPPDILTSKLTDVDFYVAETPINTTLTWHPYTPHLSTLPFLLKTPLENSSDLLYLN